MKENDNPKVVDDLMDMLGMSNKNKPKTGDSALDSIRNMERMLEKKK